MKAQNFFRRKIGRKNFFYSVGAGLAGYAVMKTFPFGLLSKKLFNSKKDSEKISVKINPFAVSRNKIGGNNVGR